MANQLVHPDLKRGHSNWLEASHNVLIRFRPKHIHLERLHYETSTNLGLLQANMTYMYTKRGPSYHWIPDLYQRLRLPVYDGLREVLESSNRKRKQTLDKQKTDERKKRRIHLKMERTKDAQRRKVWSKKHGHDTYGDTDDLDCEAKPTVSKKVKTSTGGKCKCGSTTHKRSNHRDCPLNKKNLSYSAIPPAAVQHKKDLASDDIVQHKDDLCPHEDREESLYSDGLSSDGSAGESSSGECYHSDESDLHSSCSDDDRACAMCVVCLSERLALQSPSSQGVDQVCHVPRPPQAQIADTRAGRGI